MNEEALTFDFGFCAVGEDEINAQAIAEHSANAEDLERRLEAMHKAMLYFLNKLKENPELEYIKWPDRVEHIDAFEDRLETIRYKG